MRVKEKILSILICDHKMLAISLPKRLIVKTWFHIFPTIEKDTYFLGIHLVMFKNQQPFGDQLFHWFACVGNLLKIIEVGIFVNCLLCTSNFKIFHRM
jgi:hypothetical protein